MSTVVLPPNTPQAHLDDLPSNKVTTLIVREGTSGSRPLSKAASAMSSLQRLELYNINVSLPDLSNASLKFLTLVDCFGFNEAQLKSFKERHPDTKVTVQFT